MKSIAKTALKDVVAALVGLLPGGDLLKGTAREAAEAAMFALSNKDRNAVQTVTDEIFKTLTKSPESLSPDDPGRAVSAAYDVVDTVRRSKLDADRIIDCELDPSQLYVYLLKFPAAGIESASRGRRMLYDSYLRAFADKVIDAVFVTTPFQRRLHHRLLSNQRKIMKVIEERLPDDGEDAVVEG